MKKRYLFSEFFLIIFLSNSAFAEDTSIAEAYKAARLLSSATQSGISYYDFNQQVSNLFGLIDIAIEDNKPSKITSQFKRIKDTYSDIKILWSCDIKTKYLEILPSCLTQDFKDRNKDFMQEVQKRLAETQEPLLGSPGVTKSFAHNGVTTDTQIIVMLTNASQEVSVLGSIIKNQNLQSKPKR